jgi:hypothetical protein
MNWRKRKRRDARGDGREESIMDRRFDAEVEGLRNATPPPGLWARIEASLEEEKSRSERSGDSIPARPQRLHSIGFPFRPWILAPASALALAALGAAVFFALRSTPPAAGPEPKFLAASALAQVELKEKEYVQAIDALESRALPKLESLNFELMALYRDRLETIDAQIERCREALDTNPANAHIRRYMLAALQDKQETLAQILSFD